MKNMTVPQKAIHSLRNYSMVVSGFAELAEGGSGDAQKSLLEFISARAPQVLEDLDVLSDAIRIRLPLQVLAAA
jgi:hypothetical protein